MSFLCLLPAVGPCAISDAEGETAGAQKRIQATATGASRVVARVRSLLPSSSDWPGQAPRSGLDQASLRSIRSRDFGRSPSGQGHLRRQKTGASRDTENSKGDGRAMTLARRSHRRRADREAKGTSGLHRRRDVTGTAPQRLPRVFDTRRGALLKPASACKVTDTHSSTR